VLAYHFSEDRDFFATVVTRSSFFFAPPEDPMHELYRRHHDLQTELFRQGQLSGELRRDVPAGQLAEVFTAVYLLAILNWLTGTGYVAPKEALEPRLLRAIDVFADGCAVPRGRERARAAHIRAPAKPRRRRPVRKLGSIST
jgi:hypothetical protein